jgi:hypothetical protein
LADVGIKYEHARRLRVVQKRNKKQVHSMPNAPSGVSTMAGAAAAAGGAACNISELD